MIIEVPVLNWVAGTTNATPRLDSIIKLQLSQKNLRKHKSKAKQSKAKIPFPLLIKIKGMGMGMGMEDFRSKSCGNGKFQTDSSMAGPSAFGVNGMQDLRCYSANYSYNAQQQQTKTKAKTTSKSWSLTDPELLRKKRVASYKVYSVEGKVKGSFRKSFRWIKERYTRVVYGSP